MNQSQILEGSNAIARTIKNIQPAVVSAYPITPQTHIVEDLAKFKADGLACYEYVRAESEFAAASIVLGASATGVRVYSATSSQGLLLMAEVIYNIAGMRLPVVMTCANRAVSAPINIWNDQEDVMAVRDAGWILLFAENHQEAVNQHIMAFKIAEQLKLPVMVNVDGYVMTHTYEPVVIPEVEQIKKYLPDYEPEPGQYLDPANPVTLGALVTPEHYMEIRQKLHDDLTASIKIINQEFLEFNSKFNPPERFRRAGIQNSKLNLIDNGLFEYIGPKKPTTIVIALGSIIGTIKHTLINRPPYKGPASPAKPVSPSQGGRGEGIKEGLFSENSGVGILKIKCFRPFPAEQILKIIKPAKNIAVIDKAISLGALGPLATDIKAMAQGKANISSFIVGLGGRDVTGEMIKKIIKLAGRKNDKAVFIGK